MMESIIFMNKGDIYYYVRVLKKFNICEILDLKIRTVAEDYFVGVEKKEKQYFLFNYSDIDNIIFKNKKDALEKIMLLEK